MLAAGFVLHAALHAAAAAVAHGDQQEAGWERAPRDDL